MACTEAALKYTAVGKAPEAIYLACTKKVSKRRLFNGNQQRTDERHVCDYETHT